MAHTTLVSSEALASHLDGSWLIVDCRYDLKDEGWGRREYLAAHIPGAVYASLSHDLSAAPTGRNGRHPIPSDNGIAATFGRLGIGAGTQVVMYDQDTGMFASRMWWMLRYMGHDAAAVLDGGWATWVREQRPIQSGAEARPVAEFRGHVRPHFRVELHDVETMIGDSAVLLVDARAAERFEGKTEPLDRAPGHIPSAVNHFYKSNLAPEGTMLPASQLREAFQRLIGDRSPEQVVMYCGSGVSACHNLLAMEHAGLSGTKLYPGSWSEWSSDPQRAVETGPGRRSR